MGKLSENGSSDFSVDRISTGWLNMEREMRTREPADEQDEECWQYVFDLALDSRPEALPIIDAIFGKSTAEQIESFEPALLYPFTLDNVDRVAPAFAGALLSLPHLRRHFLDSLAPTVETLGEWPRIILRSILDGDPGEGSPFLFNAAREETDAATVWGLLRTAARTGSALPSESQALLKVPQKIDPYFLGMIASLVEADHTQFEDQLLSQSLFVPSMWSLDDEGVDSIVSILRASRTMRALVKRTFLYAAGRNTASSVAIENAVIDLLDGDDSLDPDQLRLMQRLEHDLRKD
jgi:hypothetical protein